MPNSAQSAGFSGLAHDELLHYLHRFFNLVGLLLVSIDHHFDQAILFRETELKFRNHRMDEVGQLNIGNGPLLICIDPAKHLLADLLLLFLIHEDPKVFHLWSKSVGENTKDASKVLLHLCEAQLHVLVCVHIVQDEEDFAVRWRFSIKLSKIVHVHEKRLQLRLIQMPILILIEFLENRKQESIQFLRMGCAF